MGSRLGSTRFTAARSLPCPLELAMVVGVFFAICAGVPWLMSHQSGLIAQVLNQGISAALGPIAWMMLSTCCVAALALFVGCYQRRKLLDTRTTLENLAANGWRQFELFVGEAFRRQCYAIEETGLGGAGGGLELILYRDGGRTLVQCKQWKRQQVGISVLMRYMG